MKESHKFAEKMETRGKGIDQQASSTNEGNSSRSKAYCKCSEGWSCVITRTEGPDAGKVFAKCGGNCVCIIDADGTVTEDIKVQKELEAIGEGAFCKCGEGWSCVITKIEDPKPFFECSQGCSCVTTA